MKIDFIYKIRKIIPESVDEFYESILGLESFRQFFDSPEKLENQRKAFLGLFENILDKYEISIKGLKADKTCSKIEFFLEKETCLQKYIKKDDYLSNISQKLGSIHYSLGIPHPVLMRSFDTFEDIIIKNIGKAYVYRTPSATRGGKIDAINNSIPFIKSLFEGFKNGISRIYFFYIIKDTRVLVDKFREMFGNIHPKSLNLANVNLLIKTLNEIKRNELDKHKSIDECPQTKLFQTNEFNSYFPGRDEKETLVNLHINIHKAIKNLSYYIKQENYNYSIQVFNELFRLFLMISVFIYSRTTGESVDRVKKELIELTDYDKLTHLFNKERFLKELDLLNKEGLKFVLVYLNIDSFKTINEIYGYSFGDTVLVKFGGILRGIFRHEGDMISRFDKDEFFIIARNVWNENIILRRLRENFDSEKIILNNINISLKVNGGIIKSDKRFSSNELIGISYQLVNKLKEMGRGADSKGLRGSSFIGYSGAKKHFSLYNKKIEKKDFILRAIEEDRIIPVFQPILNLKNFNIDRVEALMRIKGKDGKLHHPYEYILIAEEFGLIEHMDLIMIEKSLKILKDLNNEKKRVTMDLNLSGEDITIVDFINKIENIIDKYLIDPKNVIFEITETAAIKNMDIASDFINKFKSKGFEFALDDFGIGFSSLFYMKNLKVDYVKLDGYFVKDIIKSEESFYLLSSLISMAKAFNAKTIAEFVESKEILQKLKRMDVDYAQGFFIGKPLPDVKKGFIIPKKVRLL